MICRITLVGCACNFNVVSLKDTHEIKCCHTLLLIRTKRFLDVIKGASTSESLVLEINFSALIVNLHLMEALIAHTLCMHDEAALCK